eukprot:3568789-Pleurochrysis_carterae.AAC.1
MTPFSYAGFCAMKERDASDRFAPDVEFVPEQNAPRTNACCAAGVHFVVGSLPRDGEATSTALTLTEAGERQRDARVKGRRMRICRNFTARLMWGCR